MNPAQPPLFNRSSATPFQRPVTSAAAVTSLILGILSYAACLFIITGIPALIFGHVALSNIKRTPGLLGRGMAIGGVVMGYLSLLSTLAFAGMIYLAYQNDVEQERLRIEALNFVGPEDSECIVILPKGHDPKTPVPTVVWLHGYGWNPSEISVFEEDYQARADKLGVAFVGISGTADMEQSGYEWAEDVEADLNHIEGVLRHNASKITPEWPRVVLVGFSQGAKVAGDLAATHPDKFMGAILFSAGGHKDDPDFPAQATEAHKWQTYYCLVGEDEALGNVLLNSEYATALKRLGSKVIKKEYPGMEDHTTPPDFEEKLGEWVSSILDVEKR